MMKPGRLAAVACATMASLLTPAALSFDSATAAKDASAKKACLAVAAVAAGVRVSKSVDATDRQALRAVSKRLKKSSVAGTSKLARKVLKASKGSRKKFLAGARAVSRWCTAHHIGATAPDSGATADQSGGASPARPVREYPGGGPPDVLYPTGDDAYKLLAGGQCADLVALINEEWKTEVGDGQGVDTVRVFEIGAYICVGRWQEAKQLYGQIPPEPSLSGQYTDATRLCVHQAMLEWDRALLAERDQDPSFSPQFVTSSSRNQCDSVATSDSTSSNTSTSSSTSTTSTTSFPTTSVPR